VKQKHCNFWRRILISSVGILLLMVVAHPSFAQNTASLIGSVLDGKGSALPKAAVTLTGESSKFSRTTTSDAEGHFSISGIPVGIYTIDAQSPGFATSLRKGVQLAAGQPTDISLALTIGSTVTEINVDAESTGSIAAALAPMDARLDATSARTEITSAFINNFTSPVSDFGEDVEMAPGTFTLNGNGVGLGQSSTYFRGFPDGDYDIDFDGIPFYDTNTPTHHSWAFFPSQFLGGIDFDRSPGTASSIGPTPFGGSIHLLSKVLSPLQNIRGGFSYGSFNTKLFDAEFDSGHLGPGHRLNLNIDVHHLGSDGYQTYNHQTRNAGAIKVQYRVSDKVMITGFSGVIWLDANTPNFAATRCQMFGTQSGYTCAGANAPFAGSGINFLLTNNNDPLLYLNNQYNYYHVPTDFEYVGVHAELGHNFIFDIKPYTYNYDNSERYSNAVPITDNPALVGTIYAPLGVTIPNLCGTLVKNKYTCGVDKYNSYRKYGETSQLSQVSKLGVFRAGIWYEWANTNRHQFPSDPLQHWLDAPLSNFSETYVTDSYQPYAEYQFHVTSKLFVTPGVKLAYYTIGTKQYADNGGKIGGLGTNNPASFIANGGSYFSTLPSIDGNYRIRNNWSVYGQYAQGSIVPPSAVFDFIQGPTGTPVATLPKQQKNSTYQTGTVLKLKNVTFDADYYHIHFDNSYSSFTPLNTGEPVYFLQPSSITQGIEGESNIYFSHGLSLYLNASYDKASYSGTLNVSCNAGATCLSTSPQLTFTAPSNQWVANTPSDIETMGLTYQNKSWDGGIFNKRVGTQRLDNGGYHNSGAIDPFSLTNLFLNYTVRGGSHFDQTKIRLSFNNLFDEHNITNNTFATKATGQTISANGTTYADPFNSTAPLTPIAGGDSVSVLPGRSVMLSITFGFSPHNR
jgi:iron complex outermembrane receptor protein